MNTSERDVALPQMNRANGFVLRVSGVVFVMAGLGVTFLTSSPRNLPAGANPTPIVVTGIFIFAIGVAAFFLWRWALAILSACTIAFAVFCAFKILTQEDTRFVERVLFAVFYVVGGCIPGLSTCFAWRTLR